MRLVVMLWLLSFKVMSQGSCGSPDGPATIIMTPPPDYNYLFTNGYCLYSYPTTSGFTACFTFTATTSAVDINAGFSTTCANVNFSNFNLYDSFTCAYINSGLSFTSLIPGNSYTWCLDLRAFGGPSCAGFDTFCPYFIPNSILSFSSTTFECEDSKISFNGCYNVYISDDAIQWRFLGVYDKEVYSSSKYVKIEDCFSKESKVVVCDVEEKGDIEEEYFSIHGQVIRNPKGLTLVKKGNSYKLIWFE